MTEGGDDACLFMVDDSFYSEAVRGVLLGIEVADADEFDRVLADAGLL